MKYVRKLTLQDTWSAKEVSFYRVVLPNYRRVPDQKNN